METGSPTDTDRQTDSNSKKTRNSKQQKRLDWLVNMTWQIDSSRNTSCLTDSNPQTTDWLKAD